MERVLRCSLVLDFVDQSKEERKAYVECGFEKLPVNTLRRISMDLIDFLIDERFNEVTPTQCMSIMSVKCICTATTRKTLSYTGGSSGYRSYELQAIQLRQTCWASVI